MHIFVAVPEPIATGSGPIFPAPEVTALSPCCILLATKSLTFIIKKSQVAGEKGGRYIIMLTG